MPFEYALRTRDGEPAGIFVTAESRWDEGDTFFNSSPRDQLRIVEMHEPADDSMHGDWVIEPVA